MSKEDWSQMIADIERRQQKLTDWEVDFVDDIDVQLGKGHGLSINQEKKLEEIWQRITSIG